ncbi:hypothetical protein [Acinetobacter bereziniae]|uniref:hypothetical protein n=1 Tax=Acinetobacter bereziniae TaxID=106648 RepID=UPI0024819679|nr:hypothetical protein [Acinetobacter bereziniae]WMW74309.1 hypothetical protein RG306_18950 [Acinetobacter bereziniae]
MVKMKSLCMITAICATSSLYAQTDTHTQPYGDNPNIFRVLAHKTGEAVQNTAEKVGDATEKAFKKSNLHLMKPLKIRKNIPVNKQRLPETIHDKA